MASFTLLPPPSFPSSSFPPLLPPPGSSPHLFPPSSPHEHPPPPFSQASAYNPDILSPEQVVLAGILPAFTTFTCVWLGIYVWDSMATLSLEYRCIWRAKMSAVKVAYLVNRYSTLVLLIIEVVVLVFHYSPDTCASLSFVRPIGQIVSVIACSSILSIRLWALWDRSRTILAVMTLLVIAQLGVMVGLVTQGHADAMDFHGCLFAQADSYGVVWTTTLLFETIALVLLIYRVLVLRRRIGPSPLLRILLRHSVGYFAAVFASGLVNLIFFALAGGRNRPPPPYQPFMVPAAITIMSLMASRLVLDLHRSKTKLSLSTASPHSGGGQTLGSPQQSPPLYAQQVPVRPGPNPRAFSTAEKGPADHVAIELGYFSSKTYHGDHCVDTGQEKPPSRFDDGPEQGHEEDLASPLDFVASPVLSPLTPSSRPVLTAYPSQASSFSYSATAPCTPPPLPPAVASRLPCTTYTMARPSSPTAWVRRSLGRLSTSAQSTKKVHIPQSPSVEGAILVQRETTVAVTEVPATDREARGPGIGEGDFWTGQAL
ncbi:hypothetical protein JCM10207_005066 [Rhodosporidiobolus poonsookiae]